MSAEATTSLGMPLEGRPPHSLGRRVAGQGMLLFAGFAMAQACSFTRNAMLGHWLSKGHFGIAATITLALQLVETLSDLGADRLIVQAPDGEDRRLMGAAHLTLVLRGLLTALFLYLLAGPCAAFFKIPQAQPAFELAALVPLVKSFMHLDSRRQQRALDNRAYLAVEVLPQVAALLLAIAVLTQFPSYTAVVWIAVGQAVLTVVTSHAIAGRRYELATERAFLNRVVVFGWPIWLSAFPLVAVFQADRMIIGNIFGMEALAGYTAAFMVTMVPGLVVAKIGHALMLPLLAQTRATPDRLAERIRLLSEATALTAAVYLVLAVVAGGALVTLAFGGNYAGLGPVVTLLAAMWCIRMVQALPGMTLMAHGRTVPLFHAGLIRATALVLALASVPLGLGIEGIAVAGIIGEIASLVFIVWVADRQVRGFASIFLSRLLLVAAAALLAGTVASLAIAPDNLRFIFAVAMVSAVAVVFLGLATMPSIRTLAGREIARPATVDG